MLKKIYRIDELSLKILYFITYLRINNISVEDNYCSSNNCVYLCCIYHSSEIQVYFQIFLCIIMKKLMSCTQQRVYCYYSFSYVNKMFNTKEHHMYISWTIMKDPQPSWKFLDVRELKLMKNAHLTSIQNYIFIFKNIMNEFQSKCSIVIIQEI